jgi:hypothetical protein
MTSTLEANGQGTLVLLAATGTLAAFNLAVAIQEALQQFYVFVIDFLDFFCTKAADFFVVKIGHLKFSPLKMEYRLN